MVTLVLLAWLVVLGCAPSVRPHGATTSGMALAAAESVYADLRDLRDGLDVAAASGRTVLTDARPFATLVDVHNGLRAEAGRRLAGIDSVSLRPDDARALGIMRRTLGGELDSLPPPSTAAAKATLTRPNCAYDAAGIVRRGDGLDSLRKRLYACYGWSQSHLILDRDTLDRLSIFGALGREDDASRRRRAVSTNPNACVPTIMGTSWAWPSIPPRPARSTPRWSASTRAEPGTDPDTTRFPDTAQSISRL